MEQVPEYKDLTTLTTFFFRDSQLLTHRILLKELNELEFLEFQLSIQVELQKYENDYSNDFRDPDCVVMRRQEIPPH